MKFPGQHHDIKAAIRWLRELTSGASAPDHAEQARLCRRFLDYLEGVPGVAPKVAWLRKRAASAGLASSSRCRIGTPLRSKTPLMRSPRPPSFSSIRARARGTEALESAIDLTDPFKPIVHYIQSLYGALFIQPKPQCRCQFQREPDD